MAEINADAHPMYALVATLMSKGQRATASFISSLTLEGGEEQEKEKRGVQMEIVLGQRHVV